MMMMMMARVSEVVGVKSFGVWVGLLACVFVVYLFVCFEGFGLWDGPGEGKRRCGGSVANY